MVWCVTEKISPAPSFSKRGTDLRESALHMRKESRRISGDRERWLTENFSWFFFMRGELIYDEKLSPFGKGGLRGICSGREFRSAQRALSVNLLEEQIVKIDWRRRTPLPNSRRRKEA